jgi:hypothetical protein
MQRERLGCGFEISPGIDLGFLEGWLGVIDATGPITVNIDGSTIVCFLSELSGYLRQTVSGPSGGWN